MYSFNNGRENQVLLKDGKTFFTSPIDNECHGSLRCGLIMLGAKHANGQGQDDEILPGYRHPYWGSTETAVIIGGGSCCSGHLMGVSIYGKISQILAIDFNIKRIQPIMHISPHRFNDGKDKGVRIGLLVSGSGCSGYGARFVDFDKTTPTSTIVFGESHKSDNSWFYTNPLNLPDVWERLRGIGIQVDQELTMKAQEVFKTFKALDE